MTKGGETPERVALSTELNEFLVEFSIALHRTSIYPPGHPSQERSASGVVRRLAGLLADRPAVSIGIARNQLVIEGIATDPRHPMLRSLAQKFHRHHIGAIVFSRGVGTSEIAEMLHEVAAERDKDEKPLGLGPPERLRQWECLKLYPMSYDQLELVAGDDAEEEAEDDDGDGNGSAAGGAGGSGRAGGRNSAEDELREIGTRSAQLWIGMARAALATDDSEAEPPTTDPGVVAQAINEHPEAQAYDQILVGYLLQIAQELKKDGGAASAAVRRRMSKLIGALDADTLNRLVQMGGSTAQRRQFTLDATESLAADAVLEIVRAAATTSGKSISNSLMRMLTKLSGFSESGNKSLQVRADTELRHQVRELIQGWSLLDPNPDSYTAALQSMARESTSEERAGAPEHSPEPLRVVQMALEVEAVGVPLWRAVAMLVDAGELPNLLALLESTPAGNRTAEKLWDQLATEDNIRTLLLRENQDLAAVDTLLDRIPEPNAAVVLLDALSESQSRGMRMGIYRRLVRMGPAATEAMTSRLGDTRWYVQRNILALLNERNYVPTVFSPADLARHTDARVRREALTMWLRIPKERERALLVALKDIDDRAFRIGVAAATEHGVPNAAIPIVAARLMDAELGTDVQLQLIRLLGSSNAPAALDTLYGRVVVGKTLLGQPKLTAGTPAVVLAISLMLERWPADPHVLALIGRLRRSKDPQLKALLSKVRSE